MSTKLDTVSAYVKHMMNNHVCRLKLEEFYKTDQDIDLMKDNFDTQANKVKTNTLLTLFLLNIASITLTVVFFILFHTGTDSIFNVTNIGMLIATNLVFVAGYFIFAKPVNTKANKIIEELASLDNLQHVLMYTQDIKLSRDVLFADYEKEFTYTNLYPNRGGRSVKSITQAYDEAEKHAANVNTVRTAIDKGTGAVLYQDLGRLYTTPQQESVEPMIVFTPY